MLLSIKKSLSVESLSLKKMMTSIVQAELRDVVCMVRSLERQLFHVEMASGEQREDKGKEGDEGGALRKEEPGNHSREEVEGGTHSKEVRVEGTAARREALLAGLIGRS